MRVPERANGGSVAEMSTAAMFCTRMEPGGTLTPMRSSVAASVCTGNEVC